MKNKNTLKFTNNSTVYRRVRILCVTGCCLKCKKRRRKDLHNWKNYKGKQWED